jgi:hypothetical protein
VGPRAGRARLVVGIEQLAGVDRETAAADARGEATAKGLQRLDLTVDVGAPAPREPFPVAARGRAARRKRSERNADSLERDPRRATGLNQGDPAQDRTLVAALVAARATGGDQPFGFVEAQRRRRDAAAGRKLADGQLVGQLDFNLT